jgi:hypothetical protein
MKEQNLNAYSFQCYNRGEKQDLGGNGLKYKHWFSCCEIVVGFELRVSHLLGRCMSHSTSPKNHFKKKKVIFGSLGFFGR